MRNNLLILLFALAIALTLAGCGTSKQTSEDYLKEAVEKSLGEADRDSVNALVYHVKWREGNTYCINCGATNKGLGVTVCGNCGKAIIIPDS